MKARKKRGHVFIGDDIPQMVTSMNPIRYSTIIQSCMLAVIGGDIPQMFHEPNKVFDNTHR